MIIYSMIINNYHINLNSWYYILMQGSKQDIEIDQPITYSLATESFNKSLKLHNRSDRIYVFKIKTNQRSVISMQLTHDFIKPNSTKDITIKLAEKPSETTPLKLELNYAVPSEQQIRLNDSKMNSYTRDNVFRRIVTVVRDDSAAPASISPPSNSSGDKIKPSPPQQDQTIKFVSEQLKVEPKKEQKSTIITIKSEQKKQVKKQEQKVVKNIYASQKIKQQQASSYVPTQVKSEQLMILTGRSAQIDITEYVQAPISSSNAIKTSQQQPVEVSKPQVKVEEKKIVLEYQRSQDYAEANSSPTKPKPVVSQFKSKAVSEEIETVESLSSKIQQQKLSILRLKSEIVEELKSDCVYPVPILYLLVLLAFLSGSFVSYISS